MYADDTRDIGKKPCLPRIFTRRMLSSRRKYFILKGENQNGQEHQARFFEIEKPALLSALRHVP